MKKIMIIAIVLLLIYVIFLPSHDIYTIHATVYEADYTEHSMIFVDTRGQAWSVVDEMIVYKPGTQVLLIMDGHNNKWLVDDEIIDFKVL